jgi:hypothetical protein
MKEDNPSIGNKAVLVAQISLLLCFYLFALGVFIFLGAAVYRSVVNNDQPVHAVVLSSVVTFAFLILTSVVTMVLTTILREGWRISENGGSTNESES